MNLQAVIDYETRSRRNLEKTGAIEYAKDPSTSVFCVGYKINDGETKLWIPERCAMPRYLRECFMRGTLIAQNASFERAITKYVLPRYVDDTILHDVLTTLPPSRWRCTAAKAANSALPRSLEMSAKILELPHQKDMAGSKLIKKYSKSRKPSKKNPKEWWDDKNDLRRIYRYCMTDVDVEYELDKALPNLSPYEQKIWELDQKINDRGVRIDIPTVKIILGMINEEMRNITQAVRMLSGGTIQEATQRAKVLEWANARGANLKNLTAPVIQDKLAEKDLPAPIRKMLEYRLHASRTSTGKYLTMIGAVGEDFRARELLLYCGAIPTARWAGKRIQPQNFPKPTIKNFNSDEAIELIKTGGLPAIRERYGASKVMDVLVSSVRGMLIPSEGCEFFCGDFSGVELRLLFWVAEHEEGLKTIREGGKLYEEMAAYIFNRPLSEIDKESIERFIGKETILGAGYGMGWAKFIKQLAKKNVVMDGKTAKKAIYAYREKHWPIPTLWANIERACVEAIRNPGTAYSLNKVTIYVKGKWLNIKLPSGRKLKYFKPRLSAKTLSGGRIVPQINHWGMVKLASGGAVWMETVIWGGVLVNNIIQGISRDLMANAMVKIEDAQYQFLISVHDEGLSEKKKGLGNINQYLNLMSGHLPLWAGDCPIQAEGWTGHRYRK